MQRADEPFLKWLGRIIEHGFPRSRQRKLSPSRIIGRSPPLNKASCLEPCYDLGYRALGRQGSATQVSDRERRCVSQLTEYEELS